jgi:hypothetical protein
MVSQNRWDPIYLNNCEIYKKNYFSYTVGIIIEILFLLI